MVITNILGNILPAYNPDITKTMKMAFIFTRLMNASFLSDIN